MTGHQRLPHGALSGLQVPLRLKIPWLAGLIDAITREDASGRLRILSTSPALMLTTRKQPGPDVALAGPVTDKQEIMAAKSDYKTGSFSHGASPQSIEVSLKPARTASLTSCHFTLSKCHASFPQPCRLAWSTPITLGRSILWIVVLSSRKLVLSVPAQLLLRCWPRLQLRRLRRKFPGA